LAYILSIFQECDITGGDIKEVNTEFSSTLQNAAKKIKDKTRKPCDVHPDLLYVTTLAYILSIFQECDITGGDIKEVNTEFISVIINFAKRSKKNSKIRRENPAMYTQTSFYVTTLAYILSISQESDITGGDIKEAKQ
jgi:hypothetical protein